MYVSEKHRFIYMPPQKTGSTSIADVIVSELDAYIYRDWSHELEKNHDGYLRHLNYLPEKFSDYFVFASVRNPYDRISSLYEETKNHNQINNMPSLPPFDKYLARRLSYTNSMCGQLNLGEFEIHALVRLENIEEDFNKLPFVKDTPIPHLRKSSTKHRYSPHMASLVLSCHKCDFEAFGYPEQLPQRLTIKEFI